MGGYRSQIRHRKSVTNVSRVAVIAVPDTEGWCHHHRRSLGQCCDFIVPILAGPPRCTARLKILPATTQKIISWTQIETPKVSVGQHRHSAEPRTKRMPSSNRVRVWFGCRHCTLVWASVVVCFPVGRMFRACLTWAGFPESAYFFHKPRGLSKLFSASATVRDRDLAFNSIILQPGNFVGVTSLETL